MFRLQWTPRASQQYGDIKAQAERSLAKRRRSRRSKASPAGGLFNQIHKALTLLQANPRHPGLHTHEFHSLTHPWDPAGKVFAAYAQNKTPGAYRLFWCYGPGKRDITILAITRHP